MSIKESSDELNPPVVTPTTVPKPRAARSAKDYLALAIATCGVGYLPLAPGTWGSLVGVGIFLLIREGFWQFVERSHLSVLELLPLVNMVELVVLGAITLVGIWAASRTEKLAAKKDPGKVVIDEVAGQMIALLPLIPGRNTDWISVGIAFVFFRLFDIVKPYPARHLENLDAGLGVRSDDVGAGAYAASATAIVIAALYTP
jgi:phosphatidylglycerophosphatase A